MRKHIFWFIIVLTLVWTYIFSNVHLNQEDLSGYIVLEKTVEWVSMIPLIAPGNRVHLVVDYYKNNIPKIWDIVGYNYGWKKHMLIKRVRVTFKDRVEMVWNNLKINGEVMVNSIWKMYNFTSGETRMLWIYIKDGKIPQDSYLIFGDNVSDSIDSRKFGAVSKSDLLGKFILQ